MIKVSVVMITYGHEKYISQAIDSILMQQCSFPFELIIANDCSPDNTDLIVNEYVNNNSNNIIKYYNHKTNIGMTSNILFALKQAKGEYIALCEGDDYWTDSKKLQKQVDYLDTHSNCVLSFHNTLDIEGSTETPKYSNLGKSMFEMADFVDFLYARTVSVVFRRPLAGFPDFFYKFKIVDWPLAIYLLQDGYAHYIDEIMACYRIHATGVWTSATSFKKTLFLANMFENLYCNILPPNNELFKKPLKKIRFSLFKSAILNGKFKIALGAIRDHIKSTI